MLCSDLVKVKQEDCSTKEHVGNVLLWQGDAPSEENGLVNVCMEVMLASNTTYKWSVIQYTKDGTTFNKGAAAAVCKQKGRDLERFDAASL